MRLALAVSALVHLALASALPQGTALRHAAQRQGGVAMTVRIASTVRTVPQAPPVVNPEVPMVTRAARQASGVDQRAPGAAHVALETRSGTEVPAIPSAPDPTYYAVRDLDRFPTPVAPLVIDRLAARATGEPSTEFRLVVLIDETGVVNDVTPGSPAAGRVDPALRELLSTTRFHPAIKDGRAVKSRVELVVDLGHVNWP